MSIGTIVARLLRGWAGSAPASGPIIGGIGTTDESEGHPCEREGEGGGHLGLDLKKYDHVRLTSALQPQVTSVCAAGTNEAMVCPKPMDCRHHLLACDDHIGSSLGFGPAKLSTENDPKHEGDRQPANQAQQFGNLVHLEHHFRHGCALKKCDRLCVFGVGAVGCDFAEAPLLPAVEPSPDLNLLEQQTAQTRDNCGDGVNAAKTHAELRVFRIKGPDTQRQITNLPIVHLPSPTQIAAGKDVQDWQGDDVEDEPRGHAAAMTSSLGAVAPAVASLILIANGREGWRCP